MVAPTQQGEGAERIARELGFVARNCDPNRTQPPVTTMRQPHITVSLLRLPFERLKLGNGGQTMKHDPLPMIFIHRSLIQHCWCIVVGPEGSHERPIRNGLFRETVAASIVASEVATAAGGKVRVKVV
jgi:hypothetical protein